jgi:hypothetical protein
VDLKIKLRRSRDAFALVADAANYKIKIKEMALYVRKVQLSAAVRMGHVKALEKTSCKYPVRRVEVKVDTVPTGNINYVEDNMFLGQLPKRLVIACVDSDALNGAIGKNPFDFKHYKINFVALNVDGRQIPTKPLQPDFENNGYIRTEVIWDSTPVPEKWIKTKEIPFGAKIMPKETPCLDLISHPTCLKLKPFSS